MLNPREQALVVWIVLFLIYVLFQKDIRTSLIGILFSIWKLARHPVGIFLITYILFVLFLLTVNGMITKELMKDYILWIFVGLIPLVGKVISGFRTINVWQMIIGIFKFSVIPAFIINEYTLPFIAEFLLFPIITFVTIVMAISDTDPKLTPIKKIANFIIGIYGCVVIYYAITGIVKSISDVKELVFWEKMFIEFLGIPFHIPLLLIIRIVSFYEHIIIRTDFKTRKEKLEVFIYIFMYCRLNILKLSKVLTSNKLWRLKDLNELKTILREQ